MPGKTFKFGDALKGAPGITRRDLYYWISEGFIKPISVRKRRLRRLEFRESELRKIKRMARHYRLGVFPRLAYERTLIDLEVEKIRGDRQGLEPIEQAIDRLKELVPEYPNCQEYAEGLIEELRQETPEREVAEYTRLREKWKNVRDFPPCLMQAQILKDTVGCFIEYIITRNPIAEEESNLLTREQAKEYGYKALEIAEQLEDQIELGETYITLAGIHYKLFANAEDALSYCEKALVLGKKIGSLSLQQKSCDFKYEVLTVTKTSPDELIQCQRELIELLQKHGDINALFPARSCLAKLLILSGQEAEGEEELEKSLNLIERMPNKTDHESVAIAHHYHGIRSLLEYKKGNIEAAIESQEKAVRQNAENRECATNILGHDLAQLENLYKQKGREDRFIALCQELKPDSSELKQWYLERDTPEPVEWDEEECFKESSIPKPWRWIAPLEKGSFELSDGIEISPVMAAGFFNNVHVPRLMQEVEGDFTIETVIDYSDGFTKAGGILVYQEDNTLIRFGAGIQFDGEVTLTVKSPEQGFSVIARGLLEAETLYLRLERQGDTFRAWCSNGDEWYSCGETELEMAEKLDIGLFAECAYRHLSLMRCTDTPLRFGEVRVKGSGRRRLVRRG